MKGVWGAWSCMAWRWALACCPAWPARALACCFPSSSGGFPGLHGRLHPGVRGRDDRGGLFRPLPEALGPGSTGSCFAGIFLGMGLVAGLDALLKVRRRGGDAHLGALMAAGIVAHNLPEGLAIGAGLSRSLAFGAGLCLLIALHDLPEGLALGLPLRRAGMRSLRLLGLVLLLGLPSGWAPWPAPP